MKFLFPNEFGSFNITHYVASATISEMLDSLSQVIVDAHEMESQPIDTKAAEDVLANVAEKMGDEVAYLDSHDGLQDRDDYRRACDAVIKLYELILSEDPAVAGNALRYMFSQA